MARTARVGGALALDVIGSPLMPRDAADAFLSFWQARLASEIQRCTTQQGLAMGGVDPAEMVALICIRFPEPSNWVPVVDFIENPHVYGFMKRTPLRILGQRASLLSDDLKDRLCAIIDEGVPARALGAPSFDDFKTLGGMPEVVRAQLQRPSDDMLHKQIERLPLGTPNERADAVDLIRYSRIDASLALRYLARDLNADTRIWANHEIAFRTAARGVDDEFDRLVADVGSELYGVPYSVSLAGRVNAEDSAVSEDRRTRLNDVFRQSRSVWVRRTAL